MKEKADPCDDVVIDDICKSLLNAHNILQGMKNGSVFSPSNWADNEDMQTTVTAMECATEAQIRSCFDGSLEEDVRGSGGGRRRKRSSGSNGPSMSMYLPTAKFLAKELNDWVQVKKFEDGFDISQSTECETPEDDRTCGCECEKVNKVLGMPLTKCFNCQI